jgi:hypothetical protein
MTIATTAVAPARAISRSASRTVGGEKRMPARTMASPPSRSSSAAAWASVIAISGEPPMTR